MKNTNTCALCFRQPFARSIGRTSSIEAPVVPISDASTRPATRNAALRAGVATSVARR